MEISRKLSRKFGARYSGEKSFKELTTFKIGGKIQNFIYVVNKKEVFFLQNLCKKKKLPLLVLGAGSNILASDEPFSGVVLCTKQMNKVCFGKDGVVTAEAGVRLSRLIALCAEKNLGGLEWAVGIPGTVGGATLMNAGAFKFQIGDRIRRVIYFDGTRIVELSEKNLFFHYRQSPFTNKKNCVILSVTFELVPTPKKQIQANLQKFITMRQSSQNVGLPSAGSVFRRLPHVTAAELIDGARLKGVSVGDAMVSPVHAGYIVNRGQAKFAEVMQLIELVRERVYIAYQEKLELELVVIGEKNEQN